uniref:RNA polymerase sigma factor n=1 Tax=Actinoplanes sp. CA-151224 TaxID=3239904 RepID=UPI003F496632
MVVAPNPRPPSGDDEQDGRGDDAEEKAYEAFYLEIIRPLARRALVLGCPAHRAEEIAREVLVKIWQQWEKLAPWTEDHRTAYAMRSVRNAVRDMRRSDGRRRETPVEDVQVAIRNPAGASHVERTVVDRDEAKRVWAFVKKNLPDREREVLLLMADGFSAAEIADELRINPSTVRSHLQRARKSLNSYREEESS